MTVSTNVDLPQIKIAEIADKDSCRFFACGEPEIDGWFRAKAYKFHTDDRIRVFCAFPAVGGSPLGFYALSFSNIAIDLLPKQDAFRYRDSAPLLYISYLAVTRSLQGRGLGRILLVDALRKAVAVTKTAPLYGIALRSLNDRTTAFYRRSGFVEYVDGHIPMMLLPIWLAIDLFRSSGVSTPTR